MILGESHVLCNDADYVIKTHVLVKVYKIGNIVAVNKLTKFLNGEAFHGF